MSLEDTARHHDEMVAAADAQQRMRSASAIARSRAVEQLGGSVHLRTRRRKPDANLLAVMDYVKPEHVVLDVGGGAGRYSLPLALQCREVLNVEPATGMGAAFEASAKERGYH